MSEGRAYDIPPYAAEPQFSKICVWRIPAQEQKAGLLYIPSSATNRVRGVVVAAGCKARDAFRYNGLRLGDVVLFAEYAGADIMTQDKKEASLESFLFIQAGDIIANESLKSRIDSGGQKYVTIDDETFIVDGTVDTMVKTHRIDPGATMNRGAA